MHVGIDVDDVTMEFYSSVLDCVNVEFGVQFDYEACTDWDKNQLKETDIFGSGKTWWDWLRERDWLWSKFGVVDGAIGGVRRLRQQGHYVEAITSKPEWAEWTVWAFLGKWRIPFNSVTIISPGQKKHEVSKADILVDDNTENCLGFAADRRKAILYTRPWNISTWTGSGCLVRADNWGDVLREVARMTKAAHRDTER